MNTKWVRNTKLATLMPRMLPFLLALELNLLEPFTTNINKEGDNGYPCPKALKELKKIRGKPIY